LKNPCAREENLIVRGGTGELKSPGSIKTKQVLALPKNLAVRGNAERTHGFWSRGHLIVGSRTKHGEGENALCAKKKDIQ